ncbi:nitrogenase iron-molybdenum cofactor biosynthesis protein NifN [Aquabacterium sp. NJ1]|uniref:nitrogenase iron-molybdenum cofactor biosynthesis protein NifN n=1 Tax=Aquabacterium sp. NJ1 TaxID=1538295 RepID=UPI0009E07AFA|nr:nitrogenase iron-molybdenum cofactor biosynthesis protein NifN [Aquabacterium sp. NJ1]
MAKTLESKKACAVNPLKMSQPLGASYAFMGLDSCMPVMHGSQGCTSFGLVLLVRHFKEAIPLQTTAMNEVTTILGGYENIETALLNIKKRAAPRIIAICSTGLTETKGDDVVGYLNMVRKRKPELDDTALIYVSTPDYVGAFEDGWRHAVTGIIQHIVPDTSANPVVGQAARQVNVLPGCHLTPGDLEEIKQMLDDFGLSAIMLPDVSGSLDGHIPPDWRGTTLGGTKHDDILRMGESIATLAIGQQMQDAAEALQQRTGVPYELFDRLTGLACNDRFLMTLSRLSGKPVPQRYRRQRSQLLDAMLDGHFYLGHKKVAIGAEPDLLFAAGSLLHEMGAELHTCVTTTHSPVLDKLPAETALIGDLEDLEKGAAECDFMMTHSHGRQAAERLNKPFFRLGFPIFDRIGNAHRLMVGYRGTRQFIFEVANLMMAHIPHAVPDTWPLPDAAQRVAMPSQAVAELPWPTGPQRGNAQSEPRTTDGVTP